jgi:myo-inositol-1(or 4)-monophosphatase
MSELAAELLELALSTARKAGELVSSRPENFDLHQKSSIDDFATQMDHASEKLIVESILAARPDDGLIGEEGASRPSKSGITWVIDPIDGTVNYFYGLPGWNISIAAKDESGVLVGVVNAPSLNSIWHGVRGGGAFRNNVPIRCNQTMELERSLIATGFSYDRESRIKQAEFITGLIADVRDIRRTGAAATDLCAVATGWVDGYFETSLNEWDIAAGGLIATEAGAVLSGRMGAQAGKEMTICAGPALHALLSARIG